MPRPRKGREVERNGKWYARVRWTDERGKEHDRWIPATNKSHASEILKRKINELEVGGERSLEGDRVTFEQLAERYKAAKLIPARYVGDRKVAGLKSWRTPQALVKILTSYFGKQRIKSLTHSMIETYKLMRLDVPTRSGQRQIAGVNRELEVLRAMFKFAVREGWLVRSPFEMGDPLISKTDEVRRERTLGYDEESRLLEACEVRDKQGRHRRLHLKPIITAALDTGCRRGELFKLRWLDVDLIACTISIRATNSKTARARIVGLTSRLRAKLERLWEASSKDTDALVFGITDTIKTAWKSLCKDAGIEDFRFHDCRHTAITRMVQTRQPSAVIMKVSGHTQHATFARYVNPGACAVVEVAAALDAFNSEFQAPEARESVN